MISSYKFQPMIEDLARQIAKWSYKEPYALYSMDGDEDCIGELLNGDYFSVHGEGNQLIGFICVGDSARVPGGYAVGIYNDRNVIDIGLGMAPERTGKGLGADFLSQSIDFIVRHFNAANLQLVVAAFNERAIKIYERVGFRKGIVFQSRTGHGEINFIVMNRSNC